MCVCKWSTHTHTRKMCICSLQGCEIPPANCCTSSQHSPCTVREAKMLWDCKYFLHNIADRRVTKCPLSNSFIQLTNHRCMLRQPIWVCCCSLTAARLSTPIPPAELTTMLRPNKCSARGVCAARKSQHPWSTSTECPSRWGHPAVSLLHLPFCLLAFHGV